MRTSLLIASLLAGGLLLGAAASEVIPAALPWNPGGHVAQAAGPGDGIVPGILDGTWWKLKVNAKGFVIDGDTGEATPASFKTTAYMQLTANLPEPLTGDGGGGGGDPAYGYAMFTETAPDTWTNEYSDTFAVAGLDKNGQHALNVNTFLGFDMGDFGVAANHSGRLTIKVDNQGQLKSAKLKTLAGEVTESTLAGPVPFFGSLKVTASTVDVDDLPFEIF